MKINVVNPPRKKAGNGYWFKILNDFVESPAECIELIPDQKEYKSTRSLQTTVAGAITRYKFNLSTAKQGDRVYVIKNIRKDTV